MKVALISGSHRPSGNSPRITAHIEKQLQSKGHETYFLNLATQDLPFWDEGLWGMEGLSSKWENLWNPVRDELASADAYVVVSPEYHGMVPSKLINLFLLLGNGSIVAHKPALAVAVSASAGGAYPIAELRAVTAKNNRMVYLPEHLIIRTASEIFVENVKPEHQASNDYIAERLDWTLNMLTSYAEALKPIRTKVTSTNPKFANGM